MPYVSLFIFHKNSVDPFYLQSVVQEYYKDTLPQATVEWFAGINMTYWTVLKYDDDYEELNLTEDITVKFGERYPNLDQIRVVPIHISSKKSYLKKHTIAVSLLAGAAASIIGGFLAKVIGF